MKREGSIWRRLRQGKLFRSNEVKDYLSSDAFDESGVSGSARALILLFYTRSDMRRRFANLVLLILPMVIGSSIAAVLYAGALGEIDSSYLSKSRFVVIEQITQKMEQVQDEARELALSPVKVTTWVPKANVADGALFDVHFVGASNGWVVGNGGTILATTDGGKNWAPQPSGSPHALTGVHFVDTLHGWAIGSAGTILATTDGGKDWAPQPSDSSHALTGVHFVDTLHGWAIGSAGTILATTDGGKDWAPQPSDSSHALTGVHFVDTLHGWVVGDEGTILATNDGVKNWVPQGSGTSERLSAVHFVDTLNGWVVGDEGTILATTNGGKNWVPQGSGTSERLSAVHFVDTLNGWVVGDEGTILATTNGGKVWAPQESGTFHHLAGIYVADTEMPSSFGQPTDIISSSIGWVVSWQGSILKQDKDSNRNLTERLQAAQKPSEILEQIEELGFQDLLRQNDIIQHIDAANIRYIELDNFLRDSLIHDSNIVPRIQSRPTMERFFGTNTILRFIVMSFSAFLLQLLVSLYRYNMRLSAYYNARGDALSLHAQGQGDLNILTEIFSPDAVDYGRTPNVGTKQITEVLKSLSQSVNQPKPN